MQLLSYFFSGFVITGFVMFIIAVIITTQLYLPMKRKKLSLLLILLIQVWYVFFASLDFRKYSGNNRLSN